MTEPVLFGREAELIEADAALDAVSAGQPRALLVGGDAGIGKTAVATAVSARAAARGFTVLRGQCLDIDAGAPFAPMREALRPWVRAAVEGGTAGPVTRRLAEAGDAGDRGGVVTLLDDVRLCVAELADEGPVAIVLEDMHWADRSTQDLSVALARSLSGPVLLLLTFRSDELTRRHPFRRALADIGRAVGAHRLELAPLDRDGIAGLVRAATGNEDQGLVGAVLARSEGNPLYAEELLASTGTGVPLSLNELLGSRIDAVSAPTRAVLQLCAVVGLRVDAPLVARTSGLAEPAVEEALREACDAHLLTARSDVLEFRHGLVRDAIYDDLLPGERARLHAALAGTLEEVAEVEADLVTLGRLAHHWSAAHDLPRALRASTRAGLAARRYGAPEAIAHLERVLELWERVPDPVGLTGVERQDVLCWLALMVKSDHKEERSIRLIREAIHELGTSPDPLLASRVYSAYATLCHEIDDVIGQREAVARALEFSEGRPSLELAQALIASAELVADEVGVAAAHDLFARARGVAAQVPGCEREEVVALRLLGWAQIELGHLSEGQEATREAMSVAERAGLVALGLEVAGELAWNELIIGHHAESLALAERTRARALGLGLRAEAAFAGEQIVDLLRRQGRLDDSESLLEEVRVDGLPHYRWRCQRAEQLLARGDLEAAAGLERETISLLEEVLPPGDPWHFVRQVDLFAAIGDTDTVQATVERFFGKTTKADAPLTLSLCARGGYAALAHSRRSGREAPFADDCADRARRARAAMTEEAWGSAPAAELLLAEAVARELSGDPAVEEWRLAEAAAARCGAYQALRPRLGLAGALLATGERDEGRALLLGLVQASRDMGARWFADEAARLAGRNRVSVPGRDERVSDRLAALTPREREVLEVLATGATNRQVAERLFISEKTVSVHVTHLLAKLGASNRGAAAALARELFGREGEPVQHR